jgi:hypothetical protein
VWTTLPEWLAVPTTVTLSVGGQQPGQETAAPSNVLIAKCMIGGNATTLGSCKDGKRKNN